MGWGWGNYGGEYRGATQTYQDDFCLISGLVSGGSWGYFGQTQQSCWPREGQLIFNANNHNYIIRMDIQTNGYFVRNGGAASYGWASLDGIAWSPYGGNTMPLVNSWSHYASGYRYVSYRRIGPICTLSGLARNPYWQGQIGYLPNGCRPRRRLIFAANAHDRAARIDVLPSGEVYYVSNRSPWDWVSLSGINFVAYN